MSFNLITSVSKLVELQNRILSQQYPVSVDTETTGFYWFGDRVCGISIGVASNRFSISKPHPDDVDSFYIPVCHCDVEFDIEAVVEFLKILKTRKLIFQKSIFDTLFLYSNFGVVLPIYDDTMLLSALLSENRGLKSLAKAHFNVDVVEFNEMMAERFGAKYKSLKVNAFHLKSTEICDYACADTSNTLAYYFLAKPRAMRISKSVHKIEIAILPIVRKMINLGVLVEPDMCRHAAEQLRGYLDFLLSKLEEYNEGPIRPNSPAEAQHLLFVKYGLPIKKRSKKTGAPSTDAEVLEELGAIHEVAEILKDWRALSRMVSAYLDKLPESLDEESRTHSEFNPLGAISGRFTSSSSEDHSGKTWGCNLQNISKVDFVYDVEIEVPDELAEAAGLNTDTVYAEEAIVHLLVNGELPDNFLPIQDEVDKSRHFH